jgi:transcriptional regulator with XRE-family HTH domain
MGIWSIEEFNKSVGMSVRRLRHLRGDMSQEQLAEELKARGHQTWSQTTVWSLEMGKRPLKLSEAWVLATIFDVAIEGLIDDGSQVRQAADELELRSMSLRTAAAGVDRAQKRLKSLAEELSLPVSELRLSPSVETLLNSPVGRIATKDLPNDASARVDRPMRPAVKRTASQRPNKPTSDD